MRDCAGCWASQGTDVVCPTISLFHEVHDWNRRNIPGYCEIYLRVPMEELRRRDAKGIYAAADRGELRDVVGLDMPAEVPEAPNLLLDNFGLLDSSSAADRIWKECVLRDPTRAARRAGDLSFGTKAETLERLAPRLRCAAVLPQIRFAVADWRSGRAGVIARLARTSWGSGPVIVRSSAQNEDGPASSQAGRYDSVLGVCGEGQITSAIDCVIDSFGAEGSANDQIFVQPMLERVAMAGVAFSRSPSGNGPYFIVNYDDRTGRTDGVTGGTGDNLQTFLCLKSRADGCPPELVPIVSLVRELERLFACDAMDVEFAVDGDGKTYLLQVRRLAVEPPDTISDEQIDAALSEVAQKVELLGRPHPFLHGSRSIFGVMPDWNPAEIIGVRPWPLSLSLYRELVTDSIWAYQRDNYG